VSNIFRRCGASGGWHCETRLWNKVECIAGFEEAVNSQQKQASYMIKLP
jgi:hypothetical protein